VEYLILNFRDYIFVVVLNPFVDWVLEPCRHALLPIFTAEGYVWFTSNKLLTYLLTYLLTGEVWHEMLNLREYRPQEHHYPDQHSEGPCRNHTQLKPDNSVGEEPLYHTQKNSHLLK